MDPNLSGISVVSLDNVSSSTKTESDTEDNTYYLLWTGFIVIPFIFVACAGNLITIFSFIRDKKLHKPCNVYILNLAIADLMTGAISMPIYLTFTFGGNVWYFGYHFCKIFLLFDIIATDVTVIFMILISYDRLILLKHWSSYYKMQTTTRAHVKSLLGWLVMILLNAPATIGWDIWTGENVVEKSDCDVQYRDNFAYVLTMDVVQFFIPLIILSAIHIVIVYEIRKVLRARELLTSTGPPVSQESLNTSNSQVVEYRNGSYHNMNIPTKSKECHRTGKGAKAAKSLAILTIMFAATFAPYVIVITIRSACMECISVIVLETFTYILWFKTAINPFLYAYNSNRFRQNFRYFLCCKNTQYTITSSNH